MIGTESFSLAEKIAMFQCYQKCHGNVEKAARRYVKCYRHLGRRVPDELVFTLLNNNWTKYGQFDTPRVKIEEENIMELFTNSFRLLEIGSD